ncbi:centrosomal protein of 126 kDa [Elysia marginata]|uniref:Centrosomal protein of 126 kDa n=1 Tax=Elysia marginata TaxID=1093978 RepID=A0AAV4EMI0_9GAST|nr:centrosomal protein of 126 kDa [Elysia marginata]
MDSRLLAGAYSQHYRALEDQKNFVTTDKLDSIARAKKLSLETNKRRRSQAQKRKIEALREEKRRHEILSKRREEQKQATEKYQRSHIPPSARQHSGRRSPRRPGGGQTLEDALRLIRGSPRHSRPGSARDRIMSPRKENEDPFEKSYFEKRGHHITRPGSGRTGHQIDQHARAELMDHSLQNFTSSKTLFEQQLEQQQSLLLKQQQQSLRDFDNAVKREIDSDLSKYEGLAGEDENKFLNSDDSCSSADSLEDSKENGSLRLDHLTNDIQNSTGPASKTSGNHVTSVTGKFTENDEKHVQVSKYPDPKQQPYAQFYLHSSSKTYNGTHTPLNLDMTPSATYQGTSKAHDSHGTSADVLRAQNQAISDICKMDSQLGQQFKKDEVTHTGHEQPNSQSQFSTAPLKQFSTDSLESVSSVSTVSLVKAPDPYSHHQPSAISATETKSASSQMAWVSLPVKSEGVSAISEAKISSHNTDTGMEAYNPRYASAISLSIWPGQTGNAPVSSVTQTSSISTVTTISASNNSVYGGRSTTTPGTSYPISGLVPRNASYASTFSSDMMKSDAVLKSGIVGSGLTSTNQVTLQKEGGPNNTSEMDMNWQDLQYPLIHDANRGASQAQTHSFGQQQQSLVNTSTTVSSYSQSSYLPSQAAQSQTIKQPYENVQQHYQQILKQRYPSLPDHQKIHQFLHGQQQQRQQQKQFQVPEYQQQQSTSQMTVHSSPGLTSTVSAQGIPVPAVRTIFPHQRPPVPRTEATEASTVSPTATNKETVAGEQPTYSQPACGEAHENKQSSVPGREQEATDVEAPRIKGILKASPAPTPQQPSAKVGGHPRDSLELMRLQGDKKGKKKSVRFAEDTTKEPSHVMKESAGTGNMVITNSGTPVQKPPVSRPASARVVSSTPKTETAVGRVARATSAGATRQMTVVPSQASSRNVQFSSGPAQADDEQSATSFPDSQNLPTAIPPSPQHSVINRPKAAAHIIISSPEHHTSGEKSSVGAAMASPTSAARGASVAHKSILDSKVKNINNPHALSSRMPVKIPASAPSVSVYHVARAGEENLNNEYQGQHQQQFYTMDNGGYVITHGSDGTIPQEQRQRFREPSPASKRVPISNSVVTRTSIVPASTKISIPQTNMGTPSYSTSMAGGDGRGNGVASGPVYDENGMRIDRTPTDEEITWLWDKVRNCLNKEDPGNADSNTPQTNGVAGGGGVGMDPGRQPPTMSTKLIDGASLGFGMNASSGANGLRVGTGFFQPQHSPAVQNNKVRPALQQQGSYLRRYGLLKQRRVSSATGPSSAPAQPPVQRASSAIHARQHHQASVNTPSSQQVDQDGPQPIAQAYMPQDGVSESTAAFIMAERLAKQSLSDSHIQSAMQDAQFKQEMHNTRSTRLPVNKGAHSALSIEEQNLLASLDKLNERLRAADTHYTGTVQYHQPYQAHLPGFRGVTENRRNHTLPSPRSLTQAQQRAQSARIRQQTRQYR